MTYAEYCNTKKDIMNEGLKDSQVVEMEENDNHVNETKKAVLFDRGMSFEDFKRRIGYKDDEY